MTTFQQPISEVDDIDLHSVLRSMIEKKRIIIATSVLVFTFAMTYALLTPKKYQATLLLQVQQKQTNAQSTWHQPNPSSSAENAPEEPLSAQIALIRSKFTLEPVIHTLGLDLSISASAPIHVDGSLIKANYAIHISELQLPAKYLKKKLHLIVDDLHQYTLYDSRNQTILQARVGEFAQGNKSIAIKVDKLNAPPGTKFLIIKKYESEVLNKILANLTITDLSNSNENNSNKIGLLQISLTGNDPKLITAILNKIADITQQKNTERKSLQVEKSLIFLNQQLAIVNKSLQEAESKLNQYRSTTGQVDIKLQTHYLMTHLSDIDKQLQELRLKKSNLLQQYTSNYPFVHSVIENINELEKLRTEVYSQLKKLPAADQASTAIYRDIKVKNNLYMALLNQIHELEVVKAGIISDVHVLVPATIPEMPIPIRLHIIGISSLLFGLMLGCMFVLGLKIISRRVEDANRVEFEYQKKVAEIR